MSRAARFRTELEARLAPLPGRAYARGTHSDHIGVFRQRQPGLNYVGLNARGPCHGGPKLDELARIDGYGQGELRFTLSQDVLLPHAPDARPAT